MSIHVHYRGRKVIKSIFWVGQLGPKAGEGDWTWGGGVRVRPYRLFLFSFQDEKFGGMRPPPSDAPVLCIWARGGKNRWHRVGHSPP